MHFRRCALSAFLPSLRGLTHPESHFPSHLVQNSCGTYPDLPGTTLAFPTLLPLNRSPTSQFWLFPTSATAHVAHPHFSSPCPCGRSLGPELALRSAAKSFQNASSQPKILECCPSPRPTHCFQTERSQYCQNCQEKPEIWTFM